MWQHLYVKDVYSSGSHQKILLKKRIKYTQKTWQIRIANSPLRPGQRPPCRGSRQTQRGWWLSRGHHQIYTGNTAGQTVSHSDTSYHLICVNKTYTLNLETFYHSAWTRNTLQQISCYGSTRVNKKTLYIRELRIAQKNCLTIFQSTIFADCRFSLSVTSDLNPREVGSGGWREGSSPPPPPTLPPRGYGPHIGDL